MASFNAHSRDEFLKALEEARRAALDEEEETASARAPGQSRGSAEFLRTLENMAGRVKSYISTRILAGLYAEPDPAEPADDAAPAEPPKAAPEAPQPRPPPQPSKSEQETVVQELHLTSNLSADDLKHLRRQFAKVNHPDRVNITARDQATRRMTIANVLIDEALRSRRAAR